MNTNDDKRIAVLHAADAERYRKLRAWMLRGGYFRQGSEVYVSSEHLCLFGPTFDAAVDALPHPKDHTEVAV